MQKHQPPLYRCPFCNIVSGGEDPRTLVWQDELCIAAIALHQQRNNHGSLVLFPREHHENLYDLPTKLGAHLFEVTKALSIGVKKSLQCDGVTIRQNNEPAGGQDVWHYHVHVIPRYSGDRFQFTGAQVMPQEDRIEIAERIRASLGVLNP
ncbi:MAG: HIT family protein [Betaproteobacteria bacterium]|nr:MAG: HIT family protein [Betaproteobacteria bacterium]